MVQFEQLKISDDGKRMYIDIHVNEATYFENRYLDYMVIKTASQVSETDISPTTSDGDNIMKYTFDGNQKEAHLMFTPNSLEFNEKFTAKDFTSDLFFVYIVCKESSADPCTPCELSNLTTLGILFYENLFYHKAMQFTKRLTDTCDIPMGFIDYILLWNAFKIAIETGHYIAAIQFWDTMLDKDTNVYNIKPCGCHG